MFNVVRIPAVVICRLAVSVSLNLLPDSVVAANSQVIRFSTCVVMNESLYRKTTFVSLVAAVIGGSYKSTERWGRAAVWVPNLPVSGAFVVG